MFHFKRLCHNRYFFISTVLFFMGSLPLFAGTEELGLGWASLLPPIVAIGLAIVSRQVLPSLFAGSWLAGILLYTHHNHSFTSWLIAPFAGFSQAVTFTYEALGDPWNAQIILTSLFMGGLIGMMQVGGGINAIINWTSKKIKDARTASIYTAFAGFFIFFEDYVNTLVVGTSMRPITDSHRISREKLAYIVDSTAAPLACIAVISSWVAYLVGVVNDSLQTLEVTHISAYVLYLRSIPSSLYAFTALILLLFVVFSQRDVGKMLIAERRARTTGEVLREGAQPLSGDKTDTISEIDSKTPLRLINFFLPLIVLVGLIFLVMVMSSGWPSIGFFEAINSPDLDSGKALVVGSFGAVAFTLFLYSAQGIKSADLFAGLIKGTRAIFIGTLILIFAWSINSAIKTVGSANFLISLLDGLLAAHWIPLAAFVFSGLIAVSTGTAFGTIAIVLPLCLPLVFGFTGDDPVMITTYFGYTIGAVFSGSIFGDHCSPISDTTVMSSMFCGSDHIDHVQTQVPYALLGALGGVVGYTLLGLQAPLWVAFISSIVVTLTAFYFLSSPIKEAND